MKWLRAVLTAPSPSGVEGMPTVAEFLQCQHKHHHDDIVAVDALH